MKSFLYLDSDGVLADWVSKMIEMINHPEIICQETLNKHPKRSIYIQEVYKKNPNLFAELNPIPLGVNLVNRLRDLNIPFKILTAIGPDHHSFETAKETKLQWFKHHFSLSEEEVVCVPLSEDKKMYCWDGVVLVDDYEKNVEDWNENDGIGLLFKEDEHVVSNILEQIVIHHKSWNTQQM